jgi:predicted TPR repeat methyltransferase
MVDAGLRLAQLEPVSTRTENGNPVAGLVVVATTTDSGRKQK